MTGVADTVKITSYWPGRIGVMMKPLPDHADLFIRSIGLLIALVIYAPAQTKELPESKEEVCTAKPLRVVMASTSAPWPAKNEQAKIEQNPLRLALLKQPRWSLKGPFDQAPQTKSQDAGARDQDKNQTEDKNGELVIAPYPISSPALGTGLQWVAGYVFRMNKEDKVTPPSFFGTAGMVTNNGSWGMLFGGSLHLKDGKYRAVAAVGGGSVNFDFYGIGRVGHTISMGVAEAF